MTSEKVYVKDLAEQEKKELLKKMQEAKLKGALEAYKISSALEKIKEYESKNAPQKETSQVLAVKKSDDKVLICHICRGKVIDGICTQCGFSLLKGV